LHLKYTDESFYPANRIHTQGHFMLKFRASDS